MNNQKEMTVKEKKELTPKVEQTKPGPVFTPVVDIYETDKELTLMADLPGVSPEDLLVDLRDNTLTISGEVKRSDSSDETEFFREYEVGKFYRQFTLSEIIDQEKIDAQQNNGVLHLRLPKLEKAMPRVISVHAG